MYMKKYHTLLYYCYSHIDHAEQFAADHLQFCKSLGLVGRIIVADDNNLPFSAGRAIDKADDNEFVVLEVGEFLAAK